MSNVYHGLITDPNDPAYKRGWTIIITNKNRVKNSLNSLELLLNTSENILPTIITCIKDHCTLGEICDVMRNIHGEYI